MNDLAPDISKPLLSPGYSSSSSSDSCESTSALKALEINDNGTELSTFFHRAEAIKSDIQSLQNAIAGLKSRLSDYRTAIALTDRSDFHVLEILTKVLAVKLELDSLDADNAENRRHRGCEAGSSIDRVRVFVARDLRRNLKGAMADLSEVQSKASELRMEEIYRITYAVKGENVSHETVEQMMQEEGAMETFLRKAIEEQGKGNQNGDLKIPVDSNGTKDSDVDGGSYVVGLEVLREMEERQASVRKLEESLMELQEMLVEMSVLVEAQVDELNDIERNLLEASSFVKDGANDLDSAARATSRTRRLWIMVIIFVMVLLGLVGLGVTLVVLNTTSS